MPAVEAPSVSSELKTKIKVEFFPKDVMRLCRELKISRTWQDKCFITLTRSESPAQRTPAGLYHGSSAQT